MKAYSYIRFSSLKQLEGDSLRRQLEATERYIKENGLILDNTLSLKDLGLSAFNNSHVEKGALGEFLKLVEQGRIERGSTLIVENLDRLSRDKVSEALNQFLNIINSGIRLVTLQDRMEYTKDSINQNWTQLVISITIMARAHEESATKSIRKKESWRNKREQAIESNKPITGKCPSWLRLDKERKKYTVIPEVREAIEIIFRLRVEGLGQGRIVRRLNTDPQIWAPPKSKRTKEGFGGWRESYVWKILNNRQVIGEYQPHIIVDGKRKPDGQPIPDYYPAVIDENLFYQVQSLIKSNGKIKGNGGGKTGKMKNIFRHLTKCGLCGSPMYQIDKGDGIIKFQCDASRRHLDNKERCDAKPIRYDEFEKLFFENFEEFDFSTLFPQDNEYDKRISDLKEEAENLKLEGKKITEKIENLTNSIQETADAKTRKIFIAQLEKVVKEGEELVEKRKEIKHKLHEAEELRKTNRWEDIEKFKTLYLVMKRAKNEDEKIKLRTQINKELHKLIEEIKIYPIQPIIDTDKEIEKLRRKIKERKANKTDSLGYRVGINALKSGIKRLEERRDWTPEQYENPEPGIILKRDSKYLRKFTISFKEGMTLFRVVFQERYVDTGIEPPRIIPRQGII